MFLLFFLQFSLMGTRNIFKKKMKIKCDLSIEREKVEWNEKKKLPFLSGKKIQSS